MLELLTNFQKPDNLLKVNYTGLIERREDLEQVPHPADKHRLMVYLRYKELDYPHERLQIHGME